METDSDGSPYEAHVRKSDGSEVTVKVDEDFEVTEIEEGHGGHSKDSGSSGSSGSGSSSSGSTSSA